MAEGIAFDLTYEQRLNQDPRWDRVEKTHRMPVVMTQYSILSAANTNDALSSPVEIILRRDDGTGDWLSGRKRGAVRRGS